MAKKNFLVHQLLAFYIHPSTPAGSCKHPSQDGGKILIYIIMLRERKKWKALKFLINKIYAAIILFSSLTFFVFCFVFSVSGGRERRRERVSERGLMKNILVFTSGGEILNTEGLLSLWGLYSCQGRGT